MNKWRVVPILSTGLFLLIVACNLSSALEPLATETPTLTPSPSVTPTVTPTPTPIPQVILESAKQAHFNGDWEQAEALYREAATSNLEPSDAISAQVGLASVLSELKRYPEAAQVLDTVISEFPDHPEIVEAYFIRGLQKEAIGQPLEAAADFKQFLQAGSGPVDDVVWNRIGEALAAGGDYDGAIEAFQNARQSGGGLENLVGIGNAQYSSGDIPAALETYQEVYNLSGDDFLKAQMNLFMGRALTDLGNLDSAYERYLDSVYQFPSAYDSYTGLVELVEAGIAVEEYSRGLVDYFAGQYEVAIAAFDRYFAASPEEHEGAGHHYKALSQRALGDYLGAVEEWQVLIDTHPEDPLWLEAWEQIAFTQWAYMDLYSEAKATLTRFVEENPQHPAAPDFLFEAGEVSERMNDLTGAIELWDRLVSTYPESERVNPAAFAAGIANFRLGNFSEAARWFDVSLSKSVDAADRTRAYLWIGKSNEAMDDSEAARAAWEAAQLVDPSGYYGLRAGELREGGMPFQGSGSPEFSINEADLIDEVETWLRSKFLIEKEGPLWPLTEPLLSDPRRLRGEQLWTLGFEGDARLVFEDLRRAYSQDPLQTYQLIHYFLNLGLYQPAIYNTRDLLALAEADELGVGEVPRYLAQVRFGPYYDDLILAEADRRGLEGLFVLSVARQESLFESFATSYADAKGLMQIIPTTGADLASREGWPSDYTVEDLYRPIVSVRLGARYLADLQDYFDGDLYATLAGYNAGPGNSSIWLELAQGDPDLFLEIIRLDQPRAYIKAIYWAYQQYNQLYTQ